eukprot:s2724_g3.t1
MRAVGLPQRNLGAWEVFLAPLPSKVAGGWVIVTGWLVQFQADIFIASYHESCGMSPPQKLARMSTGPEK